MTDLDERILDAAIRSRTGWLDATMRVITEFGGFALLWVLGLTVALVWRLRVGDWIAARALAVVAATAWTSSHIIKWIVGRDRPDEVVRLVTATGSAFPSGHATQAAAMYGTLAALWMARSPGRPRRSGIVAVAAAVVVALLVGISRVYLGVHWTSDVVVGWLLGGTVVVLLAPRLTSTAVT